MQRKIFDDLAWQHEAYVSGGLPALEKLVEADAIGASQLQPWRDIASGHANRVATGNKALLRREQYFVIQRDYGDMRAHHGDVGEVFTALTTWIAESPVPGGRPYREVVNHVNFPDGWDLPKLPTAPKVRIPGTDYKVGGWEGSDLPDVGDSGAIPRGNIAKFRDRWEWIEGDMLPAFDELADDDPERLRSIIETPVGDRADDLRLVPFE